MSSFTIVSLIAMIWLAIGFHFSLIMHCYQLFDAISFMHWSKNIYTHLQNVPFHRSYLLLENKVSVFYLLLFFFYRLHHTLPTAELKEWVPLTPLTHLVSDSSRWSFYGNPAKKDFTCSYFHLASHPLPLSSHYDKLPNSSLLSIHTSVRRQAGYVSKISLSGTQLQWTPSQGCGYGLQHFQPTIQRARHQTTVSLTKL